MVLLLHWYQTYFMISSISPTTDWRKSESTPVKIILFMFIVNNINNALSTQESLKKLLKSQRGHTFGFLTKQSKHLIFAIALSVCLVMDLKEINSKLWRPNIDYKDNTHYIWSTIISLLCSNYETQDLHKFFFIFTWSWWSLMALIQVEYIIVATVGTGGIVKPAHTGTGSI